MRYRSHLLITVVLGVSASAFAAPVSDVAIHCYQAFAGQDGALAARTCRAAAESGDSEAAMKLATLLAQGRGTPADLESSLHWLLTAARAGHAEAQYNLGSAYQFGNGVEVNADKALAWYLQAADAGHGRAQRNLAALYEDGDKVDQDLESAARWYLASARQGVVESQLKIGLLLWEGKGIETDRIEAKHWMTEAAMAGNIDAQFVLGAIEEDASQAMEWWERAANRGHAQAMFHLAERLSAGSSSDLERAIALADRALKAGHPEAPDLHQRLQDQVAAAETASVEKVAAGKTEAQISQIAETRTTTAEEDVSLAKAPAAEGPLDDGTRWLQSTPEGHYTLQLGFSSSLSGIQGLVSRHDLQDQARIYPTMRNGDLVFMLVYGHYGDRGQASAAADDLRRQKPDLDLFVQRIANLKDSYQPPRADVTRR